MGRRRSGAIRSRTGLVRRRELDQTRTSTFCRKAEREDGSTCREISCSGRSSRSILMVVFGDCYVFRRSRRQQRVAHPVRKACSVPTSAQPHSRRACGAGDSIKPGAQAPGSRNKQCDGARETGDSHEHVKLSPTIAGSQNLIMQSLPGACAPGFMLPPASQAKEGIRCGY